LKQEYQAEDGDEWRRPTPYTSSMLSVGSRRPECRPSWR